ncbi:MAG: beta strand repeat-containing protein, partial [Ferruginibacter sp.]
QYDNVTIANGATVIIDAASLQCYNLTVGQGTSGILRFGTTARTFTVNGSVTVATNGTFDAGVVGGTSLTHTLYIGGSTATANNGSGSLTVNGVFDMYIGASNGKANITFYGTPAASISGSGTIDLTTANTLNKGNTTATALVTPPILDIQSAFTVQGANNSVFFSTHTAGVLKISGSFTQSNPIYATAAYTIPSLGGLWLNNPNFTVIGLAGSPTNNGLLKISNGTYNIGTAAGNVMAGGTNALFVFEGGTTNIASRIYTSNACTLNITGGTINVTTVGNATTSAAGFGFTSPSNILTISGGNINLVQRTTGATKFDYYVMGTNPTISGGTLNIGTASTATNYDFYIQGIVPNIVIDNTTNNKTAYLFGNTTIYGTATINTGTTLSLTTYSGTFRSTITNNGTITANAAGSNLILQGTSAQTLGGTITSSQIANLTINNTAGVSITPSVQVNTALTLTSGALSCGGTLTLGNAGTNPFTFISSGGTISGTPTLNYGTGINNFTYNGAVAQITGGELPATIATGTLTINNAAGVTLNSALNVQKLTLTAGILTTSTTNLLTVTSTTVSDLFRASGYVNGPLVRRLPTSLVSGSTYVFPLGKSAYTPFELVNPTTNSSGTVDIKAEVFDADCGGTSSPGMGILNTDRYWASSITAGGAN